MVQNHILRPGDKAIFIDEVIEPCSPKSLFCKTRAVLATVETSGNTVVLYTSARTRADDNQNHREHFLNPTKKLPIAIAASDYRLMSLRQFEQLQNNQSECSDYLPAYISEEAAADFMEAIRYGIIGREKQIRIDTSYIAPPAAKMGKTY